MESGKKVYDANKDVFKNGSEEEIIAVIETVQEQTWETAWSLAWDESWEECTKENK